MSKDGRWGDLAIRLGSGVVMVAIGATAVWLGGTPYNIFVALSVCMMIWELARMLDPDARAAALQLAILTGAAVLASVYVPPALVLPVLLAPALVGVSQLSKGRLVYGIYVAATALAASEMIHLRSDSGMVWVLWIVMVVIATDVAGYFAGKAIGGPKVLPVISPKKTWAGTIAGWMGAAAVGVGFTMAQDAGPLLVLVSVLAAMSAQAGDFVESAIKRQTGVKDASGLIPGHGGLLDRFDGLMTAALFVLCTSGFTGYPPTWME